MPRHICLLAGALLLSAPLVAAEPALDPEGLLIYMPTIGAAVGIGGAYLLLAAVHFFHIFRSGAKWGLCLPIGGLFAALGWLLRLPVRTNQRSTPLYAVQQLFIVLSPAAFLAFNYILYGRLIVAIDKSIDMGGKKRQRSEFSPIPPRIVGRLFVWSDVITFLVQCAGGGMQATDMHETGTKIFLVGVILQGVSYLIFTVLSLTAHFRLRRLDRVFAFRNLFASHPTLRLLLAIYIASVLILVRSVFRIVEASEGYGGPLMANEHWLIFLDALPLLLAVAIWAVLWPSALLEESSTLAAQRHEMRGLAGGDCEQVASSERASIAKPF